MSTDTLADRLSAAADRLTTVDRLLPGLVAPAGAFGADDAGMPGRVGRELHAHWSAVLAARSEEATEVASRLAELADSVRETAQDYADADEAAGRRLERESML